MTIVGVGLIGGSVGLALRARGLAEQVVGVGRDAGRLAEAVRLGAIDAGTTDLAYGVARAEVVVVCTPVTRIADDVRRAAEHGPEDVLVTDAGSTKRRIVEAVEGHARAGAVFVGAHPIAGSERTGVGHSRGDLFEGRVCVLTPTGNTRPDRLHRARDFWGRLGCLVLEMGPEAHDDALARTSHLPHALAAALSAMVPAEMIPLAGGAFRDGTRVAGADADLWIAIFRENRAPVLQALGAYQDQLLTFQHALMNDDEDALRRWWDAAKAHRSLFDAQNAPLEIED